MTSVNHFDLFHELDEKTQESTSGGATVVKFDYSHLPKSIWTALTFGRPIKSADQDAVENALKNIQTIPIST